MSTEVVRLLVVVCWIVTFPSSTRVVLVASLVQTMVESGILNTSQVKDTDDTELVLTMIRSGVTVTFGGSAIIQKMAQ